MSGWHAASTTSRGDKCPGGVNGERPIKSLRVEEGYEG